MIKLEIIVSQEIKLEMLVPHDMKRKGSHPLKKRFFYEKLSQNGDPSPRIVFVKSLFRFLP